VPPITVPAGVSGSEVGIATDGTVTAQGRTIGRISLVTVTAPGHLLSVGDSQFEVTAGSGPARAAAGRIRQGALEGSNVSLASDMTQMVATQRAYQMSSSAIQTESQMMSIANQLRP